MKANWFGCLTTMTVLLATTATLRAQDALFADLTEQDFQPYAQAARDQAAPTVLVAGSTYDSLPRFETSAAFLYLQPGSGNLEYGTHVFPLPAPSPHWENQAIRPNFAPAFEIGLRYIVPETGNDIRTTWTHLDTDDHSHFVAGPTEFAGPPYLIGPGATAFNIGLGEVIFKYNAVNFEFGHLWRAGRPFQVRTFGGVQYGSIREQLSGTFTNYAVTNYQTNVTKSNFEGAGPRFGVNAQFNRRQFQLIGEMALMALIGTQRTRLDVNTVSTGFPAPAGNPQYFSSPNQTQVVPGLDSRLGTAYSFPLGPGIFKIEFGYQAAVYMNAINGYSLTQVTTPTNVSSIGVFMATQQHEQSDFTAHGPYLSSSFAF